MIKLVNEEFMSNGMFIVYFMKLKTVKDLQNSTGKRFTDWNQLIRYCVQKLTVKNYVQIVDMKTLESMWLSPDNLNVYTQSGGVLSTDKGSEPQ